MKLHNLKPSEGSVKNNSKRLGRGVSGKGRTSGRGHKGAKSRSGYSKKIGFEGGQMPLQRRVPKFGFTNINQKEYCEINIGRLQELVDEGRLSDKVDLNILVELGLAGKREMIKVLGEGELKAKLSVSAHKFTASAQKAIESAGGEVISL